MVESRQQEALHLESHTLKIRKVLEAWKQGSDRIELTYLTCLTQTAAGDSLIRVHYSTLDNDRRNIDFLFKITKKLSLKGL